MTDERLLTVRDIERIFNISKNTAYGLMKSSGFPTIKINRRLFVYPSELDSWMKRQSFRTYIF